MRHELNTIIGNKNEELALEFLEAEGFFVLERWGEIEFLENVTM